MIPGVENNVHSTNFIAAEELNPPAFEKVHTACKKCYFAEYEGDTQTGCKLGRIEKYREWDPNCIVEAFDIENHKHDNFYVVNGKFCNAMRKRDSKWAVEHQDDAVEKVREEIKLKMAVIVYVGEGADIEAVQKTAESLKNQTLKPNRVLFINNQDSIHPGVLNASIWKVLGNSVTWRINGTDERIEKRRVSKERAIDIAVTALPCAAADGRIAADSPTYIAVFNPGHVVPATFIDRIDMELNDKLNPFRFLSPLEDGNGLVSQIWLWRHFGGYDAWVNPENNETITDIVEKAVEMSKANEASNLVRSVKEICYG